jgi:hypothetical protein
MLQLLIVQCSRWQGRSNMCNTSIAAVGMTSITTVTCCCCRCSRRYRPRLLLKRLLLQLLLHQSQYCVGRLALQLL